MLICTYAYSLHDVLSVLMSAYGCAHIGTYAYEIMEWEQLIKLINIKFQGMTRPI